MLNGRAKGLAAGVVFLLAVGALLNTEQLFVMAGSIIALLAGCYAIALHSAKTMTIEITAPDLVQTNQKFDLIVSLKGKPLFEELRLDADLYLPDELKMISSEEIEHTDSSAARRFTLMTDVRGIHKLDDLALSVQDPLGLFSVGIPFSGGREVLAWPAPVNPGFTVRQDSTIVPGGTRETGKKTQDGTGIYGVRDWAPGDTLRHVHWPSTARVGHPIVMEFELESSQDSLIILDTREPKDEKSAGDFETACSIASFFLVSGWKSGGRRGLLAGDRLAITTSGLGGDIQKRESLGILAEVERDFKGSLSDQLCGAVSSLRQIGSALIITTCLDDGCTDAAWQAMHLAGSAAVIWVCPESAKADIKKLETAQCKIPVYIIASNHVSD